MSYPNPNHGQDANGNSSSNARGYTNDDYYYDSQGYRRQRVQQGQYSDPQQQYSGYPQQQQQHHSPTRRYQPPPQQQSSYPTATSGAYPVPVPSPARTQQQQQQHQQQQPQQQAAPIPPFPRAQQQYASSNPNRYSDPFSNNAAVYHPDATASGAYASSPVPQATSASSGYFAPAPGEQDFYSPLQQQQQQQQQQRTSPTAYAGAASAYPAASYASSINDMEEPQQQPGLPMNEDSYLNTYSMNDLNNGNVSNTNIPFMGHTEPAVQPQQAAQPAYYNNLFEPYAVDPDDPIENDFTPFPVTGDAYEINAYGNNEDEPSFEDEEASFASKDDDDDDSILPEYYDPPRFGDPEELDVPPEGEMPRRSKSTKGIKVKMIDGNLILDCEVSQQLLSKYPNPITSQDREFRYMRYQAATCDPDDFSGAKFSLRQLCYFQPRQTEIMIVVTMFNEDDILLARTLQGVFKNIKYLCSKSNSSTWGKDAWKKIVVCVVSDGRTKINPRSQALLAALGVYQEGFAKNMVNDKPVVGHIYEYTTMVDISKVKDGMVKLTTQKTVPVQLLFCLKEKNQKKINSHRWAFQAFAPILNPNVVVLLDAGTAPASDSIYHLWKAFDRDQSVAGACGEIKAMLNPVWYKSALEMFTKPIVYAQNFEYKTSNILDKPMESVFGFVTVLPGAFSAYRFVALQNDVNGVGPLASYFKGETLHNTDAGLFTANMYLAEDRILCFELVAKRGCNWVLKYVKSAGAKTDVPEQLPEFILQRRRWLNGSFFAAIYSLVHFYKIYHSSHSFVRLFFFHVQFVYQTISLLVSWFSLASYFLVFRILTVNLADASLHMAKAGNVLSVLFLWLYLASIVTTFVLSFGNKPKGTKRFYVVIVCFFAVLMVYMIFAAIYMSVYAIKDIIADNGGFTFSLVFKSSRFRDLVVATVSTYALYFIGAFIFLDPWHMFTSFAQYILLSPAYINVLNIYAFCNIHDISWGTKGDTGVKLDLGVAKQSSTEGKFFIEIPTTNLEVDEAYTRQINVLLNPEPTHESAPDPDEVEKDYYAFIRSMTVLFWMVSNFVIIALVLETGGIDQLGGSTTSSSSTVLSSNSEVFLTVILWIVAFMALFRFLGCVIYTLLRLVGK